MARIGGKEHCSYEGKHGKGRGIQQPTGDQKQTEGKDGKGGEQKPSEPSGTETDTESTGDNGGSTTDTQPDTTAVGAEPGKRPEEPGTVTDQGKPTRGTTTEGGAKLPDEGGRGTVNDSGKPDASQDTDTGGKGTDGRAYDEPTVGSERRPDSVDTTITKEQAQQIEQPYTVDSQVKGLFPNAQPHPANLDTPTVLFHESRQFDYNPMLPDDIIESGAISEAQLHAVVAGGEANEESVFGPYDNRMNQVWLEFVPIITMIFEKRRV